MGCILSSLVGFVLLLGQLGCRHGQRSIYSADWALSVPSLVGQSHYPVVVVGGGSAWQPWWGVRVMGCFLSSPVGFGLRLLPVGSIVVRYQAGQRR